MIVGGGQAGLSTGYHLARRGLPFVILEANERIGDSWRKRWDSLRLFTPARYDGLPGRPLSRAGVVVPRQGRRRRLPGGLRGAVRSPGPDRCPRGRPLEGRRSLRRGRRRPPVEADRVVVASGAYQRPRIPAFAAELDPRVVQMHSSQYRHPTQLQDGGVLVVGAANSGAEIALEVAGEHQTWLSGRHPGQEPFRPGSRWDRLSMPLVWWLASHVLTVKTPMGRKVRDKFASRGLPLARVRPADFTAAGSRARAEDGGRARRPADARRWSGPRGRERDLVHGLRAGLRLDRPSGLRRQRNPGARPRRRHLRAGPLFRGMFFLYALASALVGGVGRDAEHIAEQIARRGRPRPDPRGRATRLSFLPPVIRRSRISSRRESRDSA